MQTVFVLDKNKEPLAPCHPARARQLLKKGRAAVYRMHPFTIILKDREGGKVQEIELKIDPGSQTTGIAVVQQNKRGKRVVWAILDINGWIIMGVNARYIDGRNLTGWLYVQQAVSEWAR